MRSGRYLPLQQPAQDVPVQSRWKMREGKTLLALLEKSRFSFCEEPSLAGRTKGVEDTMCIYLETKT